MGMGGGGGRGLDGGGEMIVTVSKVFTRWFRTMDQTGHRMNDALNGLDTLPHNELDKYISPYGGLDTLLYNEYKLPYDMICWSDLLLKAILKQKAFI